MDQEDDGSLEKKTGQQWLGGSDNVGQQGSYTCQLSVTYLVKPVLSFSDSFIK